jgi:hypothetical protein
MQPDICNAVTDTRIVTGQPVRPIAAPRTRSEDGRAHHVCDVGAFVRPFAARMNANAFETTHECTAHHMHCLSHDWQQQSDRPSRQRSRAQCPSSTAGACLDVPSSSRSSRRISRDSSDSARQHCHAAHTRRYGVYTELCPAVSSQEHRTLDPPIVVALPTLCSVACTFPARWSIERHGFVYRALVGIFWAHGSLQKKRESGPHRCHPPSA